jgi:hypothetical protein
MEAGVSDHVWSLEEITGFVVAKCCKISIYEYIASERPAMYIGHVQFVFDIRKAVAATGYLCELNDGSLDMLKCIKMLYIADRNALVEWHRPITGDEFWSLQHGPILSRIYDLIRGRIFGPEMEIWQGVFNPRKGDMVSLRGGIRLDTRPLSRREKHALDESFARIQPLSIGQVIDLVHKFPEWKDPGSSSLPIDPKTIFYHENFGENAVKEIEEDLEAFQAAKLALQSV